MTCTSRVESARATTVACQIPMLSSVSHQFSFSSVEGLEVHWQCRESQFSGRFKAGAQHLAAVCPEHTRIEDSLSVQTFLDLTSNKCLLDSSFDSMARYWSSLAASAFVVAAVGIIYWYYTRRRESKTSPDILRQERPVEHPSSTRITPCIPVDQSNENHVSDTQVLSHTSSPADNSTIEDCGTAVETAAAIEKATVNDSRASIQKCARKCRRKCRWRKSAACLMRNGNADVAMSREEPLAQDIDANVASAESGMIMVHAADVIVDSAESDARLPEVHTCANVASTVSDVLPVLPDDTNIAGTARDMETMLAMIHDGAINPSRPELNEMPSQVERCPSSAWRPDDCDSNFKPDVCMAYSSALQAQSHTESSLGQDFGMAMRRLRSSAARVNAAGVPYELQPEHPAETTGATSTGFSSDMHFGGDCTVSWHFPHSSMDQHTGLDRYTSPRERNAPGTCSPDFILPDPAALPDPRLANLEEERQRWCAEFLRGRLQIVVPSSSGSVVSVNDPYLAPVLGADGARGSFFDAAW